MRWWEARRKNDEDGSGQPIKFQARSHREAVAIATAHFRTHKIVITEL